VIAKTNLVLMNHAADLPQESDWPERKVEDQLLINLCSSAAVRPHR